MKKNDDIKNELKGISPHFSKLLEERKEGFKVPDGYFDSFADHLMDKISSEEPTIPKSPLKSIHENSTAKVVAFNPMRWAAVAATILFLVVGSFWMMNQTTTTPSSSIVEIEQMNEGEVLNYLDQYINDIDMNDLVSTGIIQSSDLDFNDVDYLSDEEKDLYIDELIDNIIEDI